jgi:hypothetical protein
VPLWHESPWVQTLLSVQGVLLAALSCTHAPLLHASVVHGLPSSVHPAPSGLKPFTGHVVPLHVSATSHSPFALRQTVLAGAACVKSHAPLTHRSVVQTLLSLHPPQAAPFLPQVFAFSLPSATHAPPLTQPVQHEPLMQTPFGQGV